MDTNSNQARRVVIGITAHVDAGKTTLAEAMLYRTGRLRKLGRVDHGSAAMDSHLLERERGITIFSSQAELPVGELEVTLLDTPGHVDFSAEMERTLSVLDYAILVISGADGVQAHTPHSVAAAGAVPDSHVSFRDENGLRPLRPGADDGASAP